MENYKKAKKSFFSPRRCKYALVNTDDECGRELYGAKNMPVYGYGIESPAEIFASDIEHTAGGLRYTAHIRGRSVPISSGLFGRFNVYNTLAAASAAYLAGVPEEALRRGIESLKEVEGRFNIVSGAGFLVVIDYAHTPDGIVNVLTEARALCTRRLITVFGCGGNRDKTKRLPMGRAASELSDFCVVTSDNPRFEDPMDIIRDTEKGMMRGGSRYICIENRKKAIQYALGSAGEGDVVAILGKGAEKYQEITGIKYPYNDAEVVNTLLYPDR
jgi:UDP-N-acetylmuramyl-tripeptide synthetase